MLRHVLSATLSILSFAGSLAYGEDCSPKLLSLLQKRNEVIVSVNAETKKALEVFWKNGTEREKAIVASAILDINGEAGAAPEDKPYFDYLDEYMKKNGGLIMPITIATETAVQIGRKDDKKKKDAPVEDKKIPEIDKSRAEGLAKVVKNGKYTRDQWNQLKAPTWDVGNEGIIDPQFNLDDGQYLVVPDPLAKWTYYKSTQKENKLVGKFTYFPSGNEPGQQQGMYVRTANQQHALTENPIIDAATVFIAHDSINRVEGVIPVKIFKIK